jgi:hypothetical protein
MEVKMNDILKYQVISESRLDPSHYFQSLFQESCRMGLLSDLQIERIQLELVELMGKEIERYTNDESSSVLVEKAQEILQSITCNMGYFLKNTTDMTQKIDILKEIRIRDLFHNGMEAVSACKKRAEGLLKELQKNSLKPDNYAYHDTIFTGLPEFFHNYDIEFGAHEIPAGIDYPVFVTITDLPGAEYIEEYLKRLTLEDSFLKAFPVTAVNRLLKGFDREAEHMLVNLFELVLTNTIGCALLGQNLTELDIGPGEQLWLQDSLEHLDKPALERKLEAAFTEIGRELMLDAEVHAYARNILSPLTGRLVHNLRTRTLGKLFIAFERQPAEEAGYYEDGIPMEDEKLRALMEQLRDCAKTSDKITLLRENIKSMADFAELMEECFYEEEYDEVLLELSEHERRILRKVILLEDGAERIEEYEPQKLWQKKLFRLDSK